MVVVVRSVVDGGHTWPSALTEARGPVDFAREVLAVEVGDSEDQAFWAAFFEGLR
jgi:poly(3-hydroxybutyrate) depolymerase